MYYEQIIRGQIAAERIERIADACQAAGAGKRVRRRARLRLPLGGLERGARVPESASPELQA